MANLGLDSNGACRCVFWNLAVPSGLYCSRLCLHRCISLAWTAVCGLVHCSSTGSVRCHTPSGFMVATPSPVNRLSSRRGGVRGRGLLVAVVARGMASWSGVRSFRLAYIGASDHQGDSVSQKGGAAHPILDGEIDYRFVRPTRRCHARQRHLSRGLINPRDRIWICNRLAG